VRQRAMVTLNDEVPLVAPERLMARNE
jgi:hypothetical protein